MLLKPTFSLLILIVCILAWPADAQTFSLKPEWNGACQQTDPVDVNLGNAPEVFVRAAYCQINGAEPDEQTIKTIATDMKSNPRARRIDVVRTFCANAKRKCKLAYSNPWANYPLNSGPVCIKKNKRDIGALMMFFFRCPERTNCKMDWANTHAVGMDKPDSLLGWDDNTEGYYDASNPGFWKYELGEAQAAGLQFILPNVYGYDVKEGRLDTLVDALETNGTELKFGLFDDTSSWGHPYSKDVWKQLPSLDDAEETAALLYDTKWSVFFNKIPKKYWYLIHDRPAIYFYNGGTLKPLPAAAPVIKRMKEMFFDEFGVTPFVVVDSAFFADPRMPSIADSEFIFNSLRPWKRLTTPTVNLVNGTSISTMNDTVIATAMTKWDPIGRDKPDAVLDKDDFIIKGPERLASILRKNRDVDSLVLYTWNDLGEGTGLNRNYDYYYKGKWLQPDVFMKMIRNDNCTN